MLSSQIKIDLLIAVSSFLKCAELQLKVPRAVPASSRMSSVWYLPDVGRHYCWLQAPRQLILSFGNVCNFCNGEPLYFCIVSVISSVCQKNQNNILDPVFAQPLLKTPLFSNFQKTILICTLIQKKVQLVRFLTKTKA